MPWNVLFFLAEQQGNNEILIILTRGQRLKGHMKEHILFKWLCYSGCKQATPTAQPIPPIVFYLNKYMEIKGVDRSLRNSKAASEY